ncbi:MAG: ABC transporter ATP-binding protein, partial [Planctomycetota bacterium]|nr:ABC transporter ATP-binding protein [Planctomycetota bacterium]
FIGPNGAGKTTTIRIISTLLEPTEGQVTVAGIDVVQFPEDVRRLLGYMPDYFGVYENITVYEYLDFFGGLYGIRAARRRKVLDDVMELTDLGSLRDKLMGTLSKGMHQRVCLAKTLVHDPRVLVLDEPASGLDPRARIEFRVLLKELQSMGKTIFISSHILTELADVCTKVGIIEKGRMVACGPIDSIAGDLYSTHHMVLRVTGRQEEARALLSKRPEVLQAEVSGDKVRFNVTSVDCVPAIVKELALADVAIMELKEEQRGLEDVFMRVTKGEVA